MRACLVPLLSLLACTPGPSTPDAGAAGGGTATMGGGGGAVGGGAGGGGGANDAGPGRWEHEPAGFVAFESWRNEASIAKNSRWRLDQSPNPVTGSEHTLVTSGYGDPPSMGGPAVLQSYYPAGAMGGSGAGRVECALNAPSEFFMGIEHKFAADYPMSDNSNKMFFVLWPTSRIFIDVGSNDNHWAISYGSSGWGADTNNRELTPAPVLFGVWQKLEWYLKKDTGANDGVLRLWVDGALALERTNLTFPPGGASEWYDEGTNNGNHSPGPTDPRIIAPNAGYRWVSALYVSTPP